MSQITICDICGKKLTTFKPMMTGLNVIVEEYNCGAKTRNFDICPACEDRIASIIAAMATKGTVDIFG